MNILEKLAHLSREAAEHNERLRPLSELESTLTTNSISMRDSLLQYSEFPVIAEFKRASPSNPNIGKEADLRATIKAYEQLGAAGMSVLTEQHYFLGNLDDLEFVARNSSLPVLRKDFITTRYQIAEARKAGASVVLLIARLLSAQEQDELTQYAHDLGMEVLMEVHSHEELKVNKLSVDLLGVNCRDLSTFETDLNHFKNQITYLKHPFLIAESGMQNQQDINTVLDMGYTGCLIGTALMSKTFNQVS